MIGGTTQTNDQNNVEQFDFKGNRPKAKKIWEYFKNNKQIDQDFETWLEGLSKNTAYQVKLHEFGKKNGWLDQDFNTWKNGLIGTQDASNITAYGEDIDETLQNDSNAADNWATTNNNIVSQIDKLKYNPILFTEADVENGLAKSNQVGNVNVNATNDKIKKLQDSAPDIFTFDENTARDTYYAEREELLNKYTQERGGSLGITPEGEEIYDSGSGREDINKIIKQDENRIEHLENYARSFRKSSKAKDYFKQNYEKIKKLAAESGVDIDNNWRIKGGFGTGDDYGDLMIDIVKGLEKKMLDTGGGIHSAAQIDAQGIARPELIGNYSGFISKDLEEGTVKDSSSNIENHYLTDEQIESRVQLDKEKLRAYHAGEIKLSTEELAGIVGVKPEAQKYVDSFFPETIAEGEDLDMVAGKAINKAATNDPRFSLIQNEIKSNIDKDGAAKWKEISDGYDLDTQKGLEDAQDEFTEWYNKSFNEALSNNQEAKDLFQQYGIAGEKALAERMKGRDYQPGRLNHTVLNWVNGQLDTYEDDDSIYAKVREELAYMAEAFAKVPVTTEEWTNGFEVTIAGGQQRRRNKIVNELNWGLENGKINKEMTLGEARKYVKGLDNRLNWHDWGWTDNDTVGDYLAKKEIRKEKTGERIEHDLDERKAALELLNNFITREVEDGTFDSIEGFGSTLVGGIDQITHMAPRIVGYGLMTAGTLVGATGIGAGPGASLFMAGMAFSAIGNTVQGAMEYQSIYMEALEEKMNEEYGEGGYTTQEYMDALASGLGMHQGAALGGGTAVAISEFAMDALGSKIGGAGAGMLFKNPAVQAVMKNTLGKFLTRAGTMYGEYKMGQVKEGVTEGFQSYLAQSAKNMAVGNQSPFTRNIDYDQILTEYKAGYKLGGLFGAAGIAGQVKGGLYSADTYVANATKIAKNIDMSPGSSTFLSGDAYFDKIKQTIKNDSSLSEKEKRQAIKDVSDVRSATIKIPKTITGNTKAKLIDLLVEKQGLANKIKQVNDKDISALDIARQTAISEEIQSLVDTANQVSESLKGDTVGQSIVPTGSKGKNIDTLAKEYKEKKGNVSPDNVNSLYEQYRKLALNALGYDSRKGTIKREDALSFVDQYMGQILDGWDPAKGALSTYIDATIKPKKSAFYGKEQQLKEKGKSTRLEDTQELQADQDQETQGEEFQETGLPSSVAAIEKTLEHTKGDLLAKTKQDIKQFVASSLGKVREIGKKGKTAITKLTPAAVAKSLAEAAKDNKTRAILKKEMGNYTSNKFKKFVEKAINDGLIDIIPLATMKKKLQNVPGFNIEKIGRETLGAGTGIYKLSGLEKQALIDYYTDQNVDKSKRQKRYNSLVEILAEGMALEQFAEMKIDEDFMNDLSISLKEAGSELTAEQFIDQLEKKFDKRTPEKRSLDKTESLKKKTKPKKEETKKPPTKAELNQKNLDKIINNIGNLLSKERGVGAITKMLNKIAEIIGVKPFVDRSRKQQLIDLTEFLNKELTKVFNLGQFASATNLASAGVKYKTAQKYDQLFISSLEGLYKRTQKGFVEGGEFNATEKALIDKTLGTIEDLLAKAKETVEVNTNITAALTKKTDITKQLEYLKDNLKAIEIGREKVLDGFRELVRMDVKKNLPPVRFLLQSGNNNYNWWRNLATLKGYIKGAIGNAEHVLQAGAAADVSLIMMTASKKIWDGYKKWFLKNYLQVETGGGKNKKLAAAEIHYLEKAKSQYSGNAINVDWAAKFDLFPLLRQRLIEYGQGKIEWDQIPDSIIRYFNEYFNADANTMFILNEKGQVVSVAKEYNVEVANQYYTNKNVQLLQGFAINMVAKKEWTKQQARKWVDKNLPIAAAQDKANLKIREVAPGLFEVRCSSPCRVPRTSRQVKKTLENSLDTQVNAQKVNKKKKGISVFDFDDTLAKTKEHVLVSMPNGTLRRLSPAEFAQQALDLESEGASFDFSQFEDVKGAKKGPLADLALKRQGKFGSGDIFILTARPQTSAQGIKTFLDGIGLNIPIENITGLEDGTSQAKADWVLSKTKEGYNDFYFADDVMQNVKAVKQILDQVDVKSKVQQAISDKAAILDEEFNKQIEEVTGKESYKEYSKARAKLEGKAKDKGFFKWLGKQLTMTPSVEDFMGLMYDIIGKGEQGNRHAKFILDKLMKPFNKAEQAILSAKVTVANDFAALKKKFPSLRSTLKGNPLMQPIGIGPYTKSHAIRVYMWAKQGMEIPGLSKHDQNALVKAVESDMELMSFADNVMLIQKESKYPSPGNNWTGGDMQSDILSGLDKGFRNKLMTEFNENAAIIFSEKNMNKLEAIYGTKWVEALKDSLRRMKSGSNRPVYQGGGSRIVNELLDWLNGSVGAIMFVNMRSGLLQLISNVNFINWGDNNIYAAAKAFASKEYWPTVMKLMNSDYLVNRRDGLKINVNEAELADAAKKSGMKGAIAYLLDKGFIITRIMDSLAIATGGATFYINRRDALLKRQNPKTNKLYTKTEAEAQAFDDFYAISEETQQSSNPSKISQQQASLAGRVILSFQNVTMQYNRKTKKSIRDLWNRRKKPGMTQRESDMGNLSSIIYYTAIQNVIFHSLQQTLFALLFDDETEDEEKDRLANVANGMADSLLFGLGFGGAAISTVKNVLLQIRHESQQKSPEYEEAVWSLFDFSPVLDSKVRKMRTGLKSFSWNMEEVKKRGWSLDNPAYLAVAQFISAASNIPIDRVLRKTMNLRAAMDEETRTWQRVALILGWDTWSLGLPYWGLQSTIKKEEKEKARIKADYKNDIRKIKASGYKKVMARVLKNYDPKDIIELRSPAGTVVYYAKVGRGKQVKN